MELETKTIENPIVHIPMENVTSFEDTLEILRQYQNLITLGEVKSIRSFRWASPNFFLEVELVHPMTHTFGIFKVDPCPR